MHLLLLNLNASAAISNAMWAAELYFNEIIPVLNCGCQLTPADLYDDHKMVVVNNKN